LAPEPVGFKVVAFRVEAEWEPGGQRPLAGSCAFERMYLRLFPAEDGARDREVDNPYCLAIPTDPDETIAPWAKIGHQGQRMGGGPWRPSGIQPQNPAKKL